ncbi:MAG: cell division protein ZapD [Pseudomonadota bacterium]|nr:cell division protein ZapD [Pseudomonadota bacterium]
MSNQLTFEHPLNERVRTFLRLEYLFKKVDHFLPLDDLWSSRAAVEGLLDIVSITTRADIKTEILKELDRNATALNRIRRQPGVDLDTLGQVLDDLQGAASVLHALTGQIGQQVREDGFLKSVAQRSSIPGGTCSFDLPQYHFWLTQPTAARQQQLSEWMRGLHPVSSAIGLVLSLARSSATPRKVKAISGFFQEALDSRAPAQLLRVAPNGVQPLFPEISGHKNRFSIRFMIAADAKRPVQCREDVDFTLTCCVF